MSGKNPLGQTKEAQAYEGVNVIVPVGGWQVVRSKRDPTTNDKKYPVGTLWINTVLQNIWFQTAPAGLWTQLINAGVGLVQVANGGTGDTTLLNHGVLIGQGTSPVAVTAVGATGQLFAGSTGADPVWTGSPSVSGSFTAATTITAGTGITSTTGNIVATAGQVNAGTSMSATTTMTAGTGITATTGNIVATAGQVNAGTSMSATTSVTAGTTLTATLGAITATNGNLVLGTAGNKIVSSSVGSSATAGANSFGTVTLIGGTITVSTTAVTASSLILLTRQSPGATGAAALGQLSVGTKTASTSFVINSLLTADSTALAATDVSVIGWMIIN